MSMTQRPIEPSEVAAGPGARATVREAYAPFEGSNIGVWLGFKHFMYLMEEAAIQHVRERWMGPRALWEQHGLGVEIVDSSIRILTALHLDQLTRVEVRPREGSEEYELAAILEARNGSPWVPVASAPEIVCRSTSPRLVSAQPRAASSALSRCSGIPPCTVTSPPSSICTRPSVFQPARIGCGSRRRRS